LTYSTIPTIAPIVVPTIAPTIALTIAPIIPPIIGSIGQKSPEASDPLVLTAVAADGAVLGVGTLAWGARPNPLQSRFNLLQFKNDTVLRSSIKKT